MYVWITGRIAGAWVTWVTCATVTNFVIAHPESVVHVIRVIHALAGVWSLWVTCATVTNSVIAHPESVVHVIHEIHALLISSPLCGSSGSFPALT